MKMRGFTLMDSLLAVAFLILWLLPVGAACRSLFRAQLAITRSIGDLDDLQSALATGRPSGKVVRVEGGVRLGDRTLGLNLEP